MLDPEIRAYYDLAQERDRLRDNPGDLELVRSKELLGRFLPPPPATVLDVEGGAGIYAAWLARESYRVRLIDPVALHVELARAAAGAQPANPFTAAIGDARSLEEPDSSYDAVLLMGPLYHL